MILAHFLRSKRWNRQSMKWKKHTAIFIDALLIANIECNVWFDFTDFSLMSFSITIRIYCRLSNQKLYFRTHRFSLIAFKDIEPAVVAVSITWKLFNFRSYPATNEADTKMRLKFTENICFGIIFSSISLTVSLCVSFQLVCLRLHFTYAAG